ncbi:MAG: dihydroxyacetone kinase subunit L [Erysipelotrichaceae bacterium]|jgi:dihydroxyacetone kinase-like protein|nr:dihydroxyacetone kinase subunit L [Erysipelotrichaceae bacterium]MCH4045778.1 dihydroxyacetone kinase subunit L [Erysipelotrichaceae bacterium]MCH4122986.1 dihydroxyacetone kinase subunit L [Erysipelotrichaceae bacterium]MCI1384687.1 dihydroxyacetone kinase subunit L [Solobacterium sp.]
MAIVVNAEVYIDFIRTAAKKIADEKDYITELDSVTGDGDHWANINMGFENLVAKIPDMEKMNISDVFRTIGMIMMSKIGGSSGILYGSAYIAASRTCTGSESINADGLCEAMNAMVEDMCRRGKAKPGYKTMIDALYPAAAAFRKGLGEGRDEKDILEDVKRAAADGAESTRNMEAVKGRASYQKDKGVGHLDPGAVTMSYQIEALCDVIEKRL